MEKTKSRLNKKSVTSFLSNNAITLWILLMVLVVGFTQSNFFSLTNLKNLANPPTKFAFKKNLISISSPSRLVAKQE